MALNTGDPDMVWLCFVGFECLWLPTMFYSALSGILIIGQAWKSSALATTTTFMIVASQPTSSTCAVWTGWLAGWLTDNNELGD